MNSVTFLCFIDRASLYDNLRQWPNWCTNF